MENSSFCFLLSILIISIFHCGFGIFNPTWNEEIVKEGNCSQQLPEHVPIDTAWIGRSFKNGYYAPMGNMEYFYTYSELIYQKPLMSPNQLLKMCLRVTSNILVTSKEASKEPVNVRKNNSKHEIIVSKLKNNVSVDYVTSFLLIHTGFNESFIVEDCSNGLLGQKTCKMTTQSITQNPLTKSHAIHWSVSLTDNSTFGVVVKCLKDKNSKAWVLMSTTPEVKPETRMKVMEHIDSLGFDQDYVLDVSYRECKTRNKDSPKSKFKIERNNVFENLTDWFPFP